MVRARPAPSAQVSACGGQRCLRQRAGARIFAAPQNYIRSHRRSTVFFSHSPQKNLSICRITCYNNCVCKIFMLVYIL